ncbi:MAG: DUF86 domain-containing protein [Ignavibacteriales bacterium]|nr:DUF86 domain-containing protein [Ignavibacteriales bacterium]
MKNLDYCDYIRDMIDASERILQKTQNITLNEFDKDDTLSLAIERLFEILGEAANRIPKVLQEKYPNINWSGIIGMRNIIIHAYDKVDSEQIWETIQVDLPGLKDDLKKMLEEIEKV